MGVVLQNSEWSVFRPKGFNRPLQKTEILEAATGNFVPLTGEGDTVRTSKLDNSSNAVQRYLRAAHIITRVPYCYIATKTLQDEITSANLIVQEKQGNTWVKHDDNPAHFLIESPTSELDKDDFLRKYVTHLPNFGKVDMMIFGKNDLLPTGTTNSQKIAIDIPFPSQLLRDTRVPDPKYYFYKPYYQKDYSEFRSDRIARDRNYNPLDFFEGISSSVNVLDSIFEIDRLYTKEKQDFLQDGGMPRGILIRKVDASKEPTEAYKITREEVMEEVQVMYGQVNSGRGKKNLAGMKGDWSYQQVGSGFDTLIQPELNYEMQMLVAGVYGVPASLYLVGLKLSNQRASREMDSIGFYERTIWNLFRRITSKLNNKVLPLMKMESNFRFFFDTSNMPLAQALRLQSNRETERWFQERLINREMSWQRLGLPVEMLSDEEKKEMYEGNNGAGADLNNGKGDQSQTDRTGQD